MSVDTFDPNSELVSFTDAAISHFLSALKGKQGYFIRLSTKESGCSGYAYELNIAQSSEADDVVLYPDKHLPVAIAPDAIALIKGTQIDMVTEGINRVVKFNNPNVVAECGCGESFTVN
jgi:iron-sulfur cluster assembly accessory protein